MSTPFKSINGIIDHYAHETPNSFAVHDKETSLTYFELSHNREGILQDLLKLGVPARTRVAFYLVDCGFSLTCFFAFQKAGVTPVILPHQTKIQSVLGQCGRFQVHTLVTSRSNYNRMKPRLEERSQETLRFLIIYDEDTRSVEYLDWNINAEKGVPADENEAQILVTSGSTGEPKGSIFSHKKELVNAFRKIEAFSPLLKDAKYFEMFPGFPFPPMANLCAGSSLVFLPFPLLPDSLMQEVERLKVTSLRTTPLLFHSLLENGAGSDFPMKSLKYCTVTGAVLSQDLKRKWRRAMPTVPLLSTFAMTEAGHVAVAFTEGSRQKTNCLGQPLPGIEYKRNENGEMLLRHPGIFDGYFGSPDETLQVLKPNGWFHTGDRIEIDLDGDWIYHSRIKDLIKHEGWSITPITVEIVIREMVGVLDVKVFGLPTDTGNELIIAAIRPTPSLTSEEVLRHCSNKLPTYMIPDEIVFIDNDAYSHSGKILKHLVLAKLSSK